MNACTVAVHRVLHYASSANTAQSKYIPAAAAVAAAAPPTLLPFASDNIHQANPSASAAAADFHQKQLKHVGKQLPPDQKYIVKCIEMRSKQIQNEPKTPQKRMKPIKKTSKLLKQRLNPIRKKVENILEKE